ERKHEHVIATGSAAATFNSSAIGKIDVERAGGAVSHPGDHADQRHGLANVDDLLKARDGVGEDRDPIVACWESCGRAQRLGFEYGVRPVGGGIRGQKESLPAVELHQLNERVV